MLMSYSQPSDTRSSQERAMASKRHSTGGQFVSVPKLDTLSAAPAQLQHQPQPGPAMTPRSTARPGGLGVYVEKSTIKRGLAVTGIVPGSWSDMCGLAPGDTILSLNSSPAESAQDIKNALADPLKDEMSFVVCNAVGTNFRFNLPLPLQVPEYHVFGFLFEQDPQYGFHIITGVLKNGLAEAAGLQQGTCLRRVDGQNILGMRQSEVRKRIIGGFSDYVTLSLQASGAMVLHDIYIPRNMRDQAKGEDEGDDDEYCDGWSEKIFSDEQSAAKVDKWMDLNPTTVGGWDDSMEFPHAHDSSAATDEPAAPPSIVLARHNDVDENNSPQVDGDGAIELAKPQASPPKPQPVKSQAQIQRRQPPPGATDSPAKQTLSGQELALLAQRLEEAKQDILRQFREKQAESFEHFNTQTSAVRGVLSTALQALRNDREEREKLRKRRSQLEKRIMELEQTIIVLKGT